jgi:CheY-like chemotaxis protein
MTSKKRVLVADDDPEFVHYARICLALVGIRDVVKVGSGLEALEALADELTGFDLVIADVRMPTLSGIQLLAMARTAGCATPFAIITAYADSRVVHTVRALDAVLLLVKPLEPGELISAVATLVPGLASASPVRRSSDDAGNEQLEL